MWLLAAIKNQLEPACLFPILPVTMSNQISSLSTAQLRHAADLQEKIETLNDELASLLGISAPAPAKAPAKKKGGMSAAGRAKIAAAQKARWAKAKAGKPAAKAVAAKAPAKKRSMSPAARAKIAAAAKARWAKAKAAGKKSL